MRIFCASLFQTKTQKAAEAEEVKTETTGHNTPHPSDVLDMPVDPNEPTYCLCHQVSYGEMIGCDNPDVNQDCIDVFIPLTNTFCIVSFLVPDRMVPLCVCWPDHKTKRQMVLSEMFTGP